MTILIKNFHPSGYLTVSPKTVENILVEDLENIVGVFRSSAGIKDFLYELSKEHELCPKLMGLEKTKKSCFSYSFKHCRGACKGQENALSYNLRFEEAFYSHKIKRWLFDKPIYIVESSEQKKQIHVVDKWCYLGSINDDSSLEEDKVSQYNFDYDTYKIISSFISSPKNAAKIQIIQK
jgi:DNA polymerase-3 subunit epsilon